MASLEWAPSGYRDAPQQRADCSKDRGQDQEDQPLNDNEQTPMLGGPPPLSKRPFSASPEQFQIPGLVCSVILLVMAIIPPIITYSTTLRNDPNVRPALSAVAWAGFAFTVAGAFIAYGVLDPLLLTLHGTLTGIIGAAMTSSFTAVANEASVRCGMSQAASAGCGGCECAATSTCTAALLASGTSTGCSECIAWGSDTCADLTKGSSVANWGGILMAPMLAIAAALSLFLAQRITAHKQLVFAQLEHARRMLAECYNEIRDEGALVAHDPDEVRQAMGMMMEAGVADLKEEVHGLVFAARDKGIHDFDAFLPCEAMPGRKNWAHSDSNNGKTSTKVAPQELLQSKTLPHTLSLEISPVGVDQQTSLGPIDEQGIGAVQVQDLEHLSDGGLHDGGGDAFGAAAASMDADDTAGKKLKKTKSKREKKRRSKEDEEVDGADLDKDAERALRKKKSKKAKDQDQEAGDADQDKEDGKKKKKKKKEDKDGDDGGDKEDKREKKRRSKEDEEIDGADKEAERAMRKKKSKKAKDEGQEAGDEDAEDANKEKKKKKKKKKDET